MSDITYIVNFSTRNGDAVLGVFSVDYANPGSPQITSINIESSRYEVLNDVSLVSLNPVGSGRFLMEAMLFSEVLRIDYTDSGLNGAEVTLNAGGYSGLWELGGFSPYEGDGLIASTSLPDITYHVHFTNRDGVQVSGDFTVNYIDPLNPQMTAINITTSDGFEFNDPSGAWVVLNDIATSDIQIQLDSRDGKLVLDFMDPGFDGVNAILRAENSTGFYPGGVLNWTHAYESGGTISVSEDFACFVRGTSVCLDVGDVLIEELRIGDLIVGHDGRKAPVRWIGRQKVHSAFASKMGSLPVCISSGALGKGLPVRDLYVSPDHAMYLDDCILVHAKALVNGTSIYQVKEWEGDVEYFHIETENHEIILAEGAPAETFIDNVSRKAFYNHAEYEALYPDAKPMVELDIPRVKFARQLPMAIKRRLGMNCNKKQVA